MDSTGFVPFRTGAPCGLRASWTSLLEKTKNTKVQTLGSAYWPFRLFSWHISRTQSFQENRLTVFHVRVVLKQLVSLIGHLVACSARISVDTRTDRTTTVILAAHARRGLTSKAGSSSRAFDDCRLRHASLIAS